MKILDLNGVSILWRRIKTLFARKNETVSNISRNNTTFTVTRADGTTFTFDQKDTTYNNATTTTAGLMSATDKSKLNSIENGAQENVVESVSVNGTKQAVTNKGINITVPTAVSDLNNDLGYLTEESDPTVPSWAKQAQKPVYTASEVGALSADTHIPTNVSELENDAGYLTEHQDISGIEDAIAGLTTKLNALADSDDTTLDQLSEIVAYIKNNKSLIDGITTGKVSVTDIVDNLTSNAANKPLSAKQGKILKDLIDGIVVPTKTSELTNDSGFVTNSDIATPDWNAASDESGYIDNKPNIRQGTDANHTAVAENSGTTASGANSHAEGGGTRALGNWSHAEGGGSTASGNQSHAEGGGSTASGLSSHAEGSSHAIGDYSHAEGGSTNATASSSHSEGGGTTASGRYAHSEGSGTTASKDGSHAEGGGTIASGTYSHAEGFGTKASSAYQHVQGKYNIEDTEDIYAHIVGNGDSKTRSNAHTLDWDGNAWFAGKVTANGTPVDNNDLTNKQYVDSAIATYNNLWEVGSGVNSIKAKTASDASGEASYAEGLGTVASGMASHAEGARTTASGDYSHSEGGEGTVASGSYSHAEGSQAKAIGTSSHAEGGSTEARGNSSHAEGFKTIATSNYQHVQGFLNEEDTNNKYAHIVGGGSMSYGTPKRKNIHTLDWSGNAWYAGKVTIDGTPTANNDLTTKSYVDSALSGKANTADLATVATSGSYADLTDKLWESGTGEDSIKAKTATESSGKVSYAEGISTKATGDYSHAECAGTTASGDYSHAEGAGSAASGGYSHAEGSGTTASGPSSHSEGGGAKAIGNCSHAEGAGTAASGTNSHAENGGTTASGNQSHAEGSSTIAASDNQHVQGKFNIEDSNGVYAHIVGGGTDRNHRANIHTLDWSGNAVYAGKVTVGVAPTADLDVATKKYVDDNIPTVPTNVSSFTNDVGYLTQHQDISGKANTADLATVATSGSYNDLSNKPTIPTVPTNVSEFNNDASYANEQYVDDAIATALADVVGIDYHVCTANEYDAQTYIPTLEGAPGVIYLVPKPASLIGSATVGSSSVSGNNIYYEFIYNGRSFEMIGDTQVSLDGYLEDSDISTDAQVQTVITEVFGGE